MNKITIIILTLIGLGAWSCVRNKYVDNILEERYINRTNKDFFCIFYTTHGADSAFCGKYDTISLIFKHTFFTDFPPVGPYALDEGEYPSGINAIIYSLTDTTKYISDYVDDMTEEEIKEAIRSDWYFGFRHEINTLYLTDEFLKFFRKDYTMLNRFKDYYQAENKP